MPNFELIDVSYIIYKKMIFLGDDFFCDPMCFIIIFFFFFILPLFSYTWPFTIIDMSVRLDPVFFKHYIFCGIIIRNDLKSKFKKSDIFMS